MKAYQKMKAAIVDLSEVLDETVAFKSYQKNVQLKPALAGLSFAFDYGAEENKVRAQRRGAAAPASNGKEYDASRFTKICLS